MQLLGLLHDASEAYLVDLPRPVKRAAPWGVGYREDEARVQAVIFERMGLDHDEYDWHLVEHADAVLLATEARDLMAPPPVPWTDMPAPLADPIFPWSPGLAKFNFMDCFRNLRNLHGAA